MWPAFVACTAPPVVVPPAADTDEVEEGDPEEDPSDDTNEDAGTDADGDGFAVEEGDCDDGDVWVNPGWPEQDDDDKDNDCDGRVDEVWAGLLVADVDKTGISGEGRLLTVDPVGDVEQDRGIVGSVSPYWMDEDRVVGSGFVAWDVHNGVLAHLDADGTATEIVVIEDPADHGVQEGAYLSGVAAHPDGYYLISGFDRLIRVDPTGTVSVAASWDANLTGDPYEVGVADVVVARDGGAVLVGTYGGLATWSESGGYSLVLAEDPGDPAMVFWDAAGSEDAQVYALGVDAESAGVFRWDGSAWSKLAPWPYPEHGLDALAVEGETGDVYVTLHIGWAQEVWRMLPDGTVTGKLYGTEPVNETRRFRTLGVLWDED